MSNDLDQRIADAGPLTRTVRIRALFRDDEPADGDAREFTGIGVPWDDIISHWFGDECFDRGSVEADDAILFYGHREPIGTIIATADVEQGFQVTGRISDTTLGRDVWTLVKDGAIARMSIGFEPIEYRVDEDEVIHWTRVKAREFSLVPIPAYDNAALDPASLRTPAPKENPPMTADLITRDDLVHVNERLDDLTREINLANRGGSAPVAGHQWRSMGHFLKAIAAGDADAAAFHRAYTGATTADTWMDNTFVGKFVKWVQDRRRITNLFTTAPLPDSGLSLEFVKLGADTTAVDEQAAQGDDLTNGKVTLTQATAPIKTYGGWTELSLQLIERATVATLDTTLAALGLKYAQTTNAVVANEFKAEEAAQAATAISLPPATATATNWLDAVVDVAMAFEDAGYSLDGLILTATRFKALSNLKDGNSRVLKVYGDGVNQIGEMNLTSVSGNLAGLRVVCSNKVTNGGFYDASAIQFQESAGAPAQLQQANIINLSQAFSLYGYATAFRPFPAAIKPIKG